MLQEVNGAIRETPAALNQCMTVLNGGGGSITGTSIGSCGDWPLTTGYYHAPIYWNNYPVYICTDKTKKAIEVLKALQAEKMLTCNSVPRFIELVDKIAGLL